MAAKHFYRQGFLLLLFNFISTAALEKRFSDLKRCADEECSMLLVRGKAVQDFSGPDCRFLTVKTSETIYVYYKLSGRRADLWAGSVGSSFGYFPMGLLAVNHIYTDKEIEIPAEETDFVCFDTGFDKFNSYDVDLLLGSSVAEDDGDNKGSSDQTEHRDNPGHLHDEVPDDESASSHKLDRTSESPTEVEPTDTPHATERGEDSTEENRALETEVPNMSDTKDTATETVVVVTEKVSISEGSQIPELKTTLGTTFDAVISDEEVTKKVTPYDDKEESPDVESAPDDDFALIEETPLLSYSEETKNTPADHLVEVSKGVQIPPLKTTLGTTFDAVVSDEEITKKVTPYEESEDEEIPPKDDIKLNDETPLLSYSEEEVNTAASESAKISEGKQIPKLKTTIGTTFDAVVSNEEITRRVSPFEEEESETVEHPSEEDIDVKEETPLLSFSEETPEPYSDKISEGVQIPDLKTTLGATFDAVISDDEITKRVTPYEEEEIKGTERPPKDDVNVQEDTPLISFTEETEDPPPYTDNISEGVQIPKLKTSIGTTFDAIVSNVETTKKTTPYEEEESENVDSPQMDNVEVKEETPLLSFSEEALDTPSSDSPKEEKNIWTTFGDAVFSVVTGGERTAQDFGSEEDDDDDDDDEDEIEEAASEPPTMFKEAKENIKEPPSEEASKDPEDEDEVFADPSNTDAVQSNDDDDDDDDDDDEEEVVGPEETFQPTDEQIHHQAEKSMTSDDLEPQDAIPKAQELDIRTIDEQHIFEATEQEEVNNENAGVQDHVPTERSEDLEKGLTENKIMADEELASTETGRNLQPAIEEIHSKNSDIKDDENKVYDSTRNQKRKHLGTDLESNNSQAEFWPFLQPEIQEEPLQEKLEEEHNTEIAGVKEELLDDENALSFSQSDKLSPEEADPSASASEPEYSDSVMRLTLIRNHFTEEKMEKIQKLLGLKNLFKMEAMFSDLDTEMKATRLSTTGTMQDIESSLEGILEASENTILDEVEKMLDSWETKQNYEQHKDTSSSDEGTEILDDFQELAFSLRQKYSTASDSTPLAKEKASESVQGEPDVNHVVPHTVEEDRTSSVPVVESDNNLTVTDHDKRPAETKVEQAVWDERHNGRDVNMQEDGGHFNKNKDNLPSFSASEEMQRVPQDTLENPLDMGLGVEVEHSSSGSSGSLDSMDPVSDTDEEVGLFSTGMVYMGFILSLMKTKMTEWTSVMISLLPEEWKPGDTLYGCPWQAVVITALIGVVTFTLFFWRTVLAVKKRQYLVDEKKLSEQMHALRKEREDALAKMSELQKQTEQLKEKEKQSKEAVSCTVKRMQDLESKAMEAETRNRKIAEEKNKYTKLLQDERAKSLQNETRIEKLEKSNEKLQLSRKKVQDALSKTTVLLDEAKIREDARSVHQKCLEKDFAALKEENKTLKANIKVWEEKHKELNEKIKVYQKSQKELEDSVVLKDHNVEVLSDLLADLEACDSQKGDTKALANGEVAPDKQTAIKNRIKQMMDVSRVQTTLSVVEEERDRFMNKLLNEEKSRKSMEEQHQELEHAIASLKSEKSHVENQFKILQQKNEIMVEMYQQKENALQQRLTKEELERRSKESMLSEVGGKAVEAEEQVKVLRQRINEMEEQMKKTEEVYKDQIKEQENKTHSNWVNARNAERALNQEKLETSKLREKLAVLTSQLNERRAPLFRPNSGQPAGPRQGDSYGPSPVSGGAPSPPIMIEGPRRPPSAPVGRRIDPYGPRPPSDPHGRYAENRHISGMDMMGPRSSSPANMDGSGPGSFLASPIRDSPGPMGQGPPPGPGPHDQILPPGPHGRLPPPGAYRPPRSGPYHLPPGPHGPLPPNAPPPLHGPSLPANGHPGMPLSGPMGGEFGPWPANGHTFLPRPGPGHVIDPRGPPPPHFRPPPSHHFGPMPPHGIRGPMGPRLPMPPDMRFPGLRDHTSPPMNLPPGVPPHPAHPGDAYGQAPPDALQNSALAHSGPGQGQHGRQEAPQDSGRPAMVKP